MPTIVTSGARLARHLRAASDEGRRRQGLDLWEAPDILPWPSWIERLWEEAVYSTPAGAPVLLNPVQEKYLWERILSGSELLNLQAAAGAVASAWSLQKEWRMPGDPSLYAGSPDAEAFIGWSREFSNRCRDRGWISRAELPEKLIPLLRSGRLPLPDAVEYAGFDELTPAQRCLFTALREAGCPVVESAAPAVPAAASESRTGCAGWRDELARAAAWSRAWLQREPGCSIGVIVPDLPAVRDTAERLFDDALHPGLDFDARPHRAFHLSAGAPLATDPLVQTALRTLGLCAGRLSLAEAGALLRSPYLQGARGEASARAAFDEELRRRGFSELTAAGLRSFPSLEFCRRIAAAQSSLPSAAALPGGWARAFSLLLERAGWPGERPLSSPEYQAVNRFHRLLSDFAALDLVCDPLDAPAALARLSSLAAQAGFEPGDPGAPVQVLGMLEAAGSTFDHLWVTGLHDSAWPPPPRPNPFLPLALQRSLKLPHSSAEREYEYARRATARIRGSAPDIVFSYPLMEGEEPRQPSPLILHAPEAVRPADPAPFPLAHPAALEFIHDSTGPPLPLGTVREGGTRVLQDQAACPFRAFANHRLRARELEEASVGFSPRDRGIFVHNALKLIWDRLRTRDALAALDPAARAALVAGCVRASLDEKGEHTMPRHRDLEQSRLERLLDEWLEYELSRPDFAFLTGEDIREVDIGGLRLKVRIDRVDRIAGQGDAIIDYKTGTLSTSVWDGDRPDQPQLPLYAATHPDPVAAVWFAFVEPHRPQLKGVDSDVAARIAQWRPVLEALAGEFRNGRADVSPKKRADACQYCPLPPLCRIAEAPPAVEDHDHGGRP